MVFFPQKSIDREDSPHSPKDTLPTMYDLPSEDSEEPGLPDEFHDLQPQLLSRTLWLLGYSRQKCFTASDLNLYYDVKHPLWHKRPDWFLVVDVPRLYQGKELRRSYVLWQEGKSPTVVVEFLSPGTESEDLGRFSRENSDGEQPVETEAEDEARQKNPKPPGKFEVYEQYLRVPHYIVYSRYMQQLRYFKLEGEEYREQSLQAENPRIWLADLEVGLGIWQGVFEGVPGHWLRWCDREGNWLRTDTEQERLEKDRERREKEQAQAQLRQAARNLLAAGMTVDRVAQVLGLSEAQVQGFDR
jgi:Uma2 family endonuclease